MFYQGIMYAAWWNALIPRMLWFLWCRVQRYLCMSGVPMHIEYLSELYHVRFILSRWWGVCMIWSGFIQDLESSYNMNFIGCWLSICAPEFTRRCIMYIEFLILRFWLRSEPFGVLFSMFETYSLFDFRCESLPVISSWLCRYVTSSSLVKCRS